MIDLHSHILPGIDDGSNTPEMSYKLLQMLSKQGVDTVVATPHFYAYHNDPQTFLNNRKDAHKALCDYLHDREQVGAAIGETPAPLPQILLGAEVAYFDGIGRCEELPKLQLGESGLVLIEMPFGSWTKRMVDEVCMLPSQLGITAVLAHVERYPVRDQLHRFKAQLLDAGVMLQCNADAFLKGMKSRRYLKMLDRCEIHFLGSDCHNLTSRPPKLNAAVQVIEKKCGSLALERLHDLARDALLGQ